MGVNALETPFPGDDPRLRKGIKPLFSPSFSWLQAEKDEQAAIEAKAAKEGDFQQQEWNPADPAAPAVAAAPPAEDVS